MSVGWPACIHLDIFAHAVRQCFGEQVYLVGSATRGKDWRDVDVVVMIDDARWEGMFGTHWVDCNWRWSIMCAAFSALGKQMTNLPIDFKVQPIRQANDKHKDRPRLAIGTRLSQPENFYDQVYDQLLRNVKNDATYVDDVVAPTEF